MAKPASSLSIRNRLLANLPKHELENLRPHLRRVVLKVRQVLYDPNKLIRDVFFIEDGVVSLISQVDSGKTIEIGTVGHEGMVGLPLFLGARSSPLQAFAQVSGNAWKLSKLDFQRALRNGCSSLSIALHRYTQALFVQLSMAVACNRLHPIHQRAARWLLTTHDRVGRNQFELSQEFMAQMLGVRRASANAAMQELRRKGMIEYRNGRMSINDRKKLESIACECYFTIRDEYRKLT